MVTDAMRAQVAAQCKAVAHLALALHQIHSDYEKLMASGSHDAVIDLVGNRTVYFMEVLGDMLNGMDAADENDGWLGPIYEEAHRLWPQKIEHA